MGISKLYTTPCSKISNFTSGNWGGAVSYNIMLLTTFCGYTSVFQVSDYSRYTCGEMLTSVNLLSVLQVRLVFGKAGLEIAG